jgi:hypothetical protein
MGRPIVVTAAPLAAAVANGIVLSTAPPLGVVPLTGSKVVNGVAVLDQARQIAFASTGNNSNTTFTITGADAWGGTQSEAVVGGNIATVVTTKNYKTVTSITSSAASVAGLTVGTNSSPAITSSGWVRFDTWNMAGVALQVTANGTVNYTVQQTLDDPNSPTDPVLPANVTWVAHPDATLVGATTSLQGNYAYTPTFARVLLNSGTGTVTATFIQPDSGNY